MAEYIDREALIKEIKKGIVFSGRLNSRMLRAELRGANLVIEKVKIAPAADVVPVVQGKWKKCFEDWRIQIEGDECSVCGFQHYGTNISDYSYCPSCGAKMDKQER